VIGPSVERARAAGDIDAWFFQRYLDGPGRRDHIRLRVRARSPAAFATRLDELLRDARAAGDVTALESAPYHREVGRYGADALEPLEKIFEADSSLACALAAGHNPGDADLTQRLVQTFDALAGALGLPLEARRALAARRRAAWAPLFFEARDLLAEEHRLRQSRLHDALTAPPAPPFTLYLDRVRAVAPSLPLPRWESLLPALLHLSAVRQAGPVVEEEARAVYFWERTLEGIAARARNLSR
jgi:thiopeptide-type bacteriocin biosynthesis protein